VTVDHVIDEHPLGGGSDGRVRTVLRATVDERGGVQLYHLAREIRRPGAEAWEPIPTTDGVKLRCQEMLRIAAIVCHNHADFILRKATERRARRRDQAAKLAGGAG
jgi:hypothetical protein